jgi:hypothetical protein
VTSPTDAHFKLHGQGAGFSGEHIADDADEPADFTSEESTNDVFILDDIDTDGPGTDD